MSHRKTAQRRRGGLRAYELSLGDLNRRETAKLRYSDPPGKTLTLHPLYPLVLTSLLKGFKDG